MKILRHSEFTSRGPVNHTLAFEIRSNSEDEPCIDIKGRLTRKFANIFVDCGDCNAEIQLMDMDSEQALHRVLETKSCVNEEVLRVPGNAAVQTVFAEKYFGSNYMVICITDINELIDMVYLLRKGNYIAIFDDKIPKGIAVKDFVANMDSEQHIAILQDDAVIWLGKASQLACCEATDDMLDAVVKSIKFSNSEFCTFYGGNTQSWSGLLITI